MLTAIETSIEYGKKYTDKNSGFTGVAICISKWQHGCIRITLQPSVLKDGTLPENQCFDEASLEGVEQIKKETGGPSPSPKHNADPIRR